MNAILFVAETAAMAAWHDQLRAVGPRWQMRFACGTAAAEAALASETFDVVVAELHGGDSACLDLLARIKATSPRTARIVLSSSATQEQILHALPMAQQVLGHPCEAATLWSVVERTCCLNGLVENPTVRALVGGLDRLPSVPRSYVALSQAMARADVGIDEVSAIVEQDAAMAVKLLQLVNSAFFRRSRAITSLPQAVSYLGLDVLKALTLSAQVFGMLEARTLQDYGLERLHERSIWTAHLARRFMAANGRSEEGFTAGLLLDVGRLVLSVCLKERYRELLQIPLLGRETLHDIECRELRVSHAEVGAYLMCLWGLPAPTIEAIAFHHAPSAVLHEDTELLDAVHVADAEVEAFFDRGGRAEPAVDPVLRERPGMRETLSTWHAMAAREFEGLRS